MVSAAPWPPAPTAAWTSAAHAGPAGDTDVGLVRPVLAAGMVLVLVGLFLASAELRHLEAALSAVVVRAFGIDDARVAGDSVLFTVNGRLTGYDISLGCTVAFLLLPFSVATAALLAIRRVPVLRSLLSLTAAVLVIVFFNQMRLLAIGTAMAGWGPELGYARTHVLVGTLISTLGVVLGGTVYLAVLLRGTWPTNGDDDG